jgi:Zn-finger nucleic acid-binding protein
MPLLVCPNCEAAMVEVVRQSVKIDVCKRCQGVWLDRGELEKLLSFRDFEDGEREYFPPEGHVPEKRFSNSRVGSYNEKYDRDDYHKHHKHKKKSFFDVLDIFD